MRKSAIAVMIVLVGGCQPASQNTSQSEAANTSLSEAEEVIAQANRDLENAQQAMANLDRATAPTRATSTAWDYHSQADPMSDRRTEFACVRSTNQVRLGFPYGSPHGRLCLRNSPQHGRDAYVELEGNGQILCYSYRNCSIQVRFDDEQARNFTAIGASDNSTNIVFIRGRDRLERALRTADRTAIQLEFYQAGNQAFIFPTAGFDWDAGREGTR